jgi:uncharacterized protein YjbJ (UPF0337 family)
MNTIKVQGNWYELKGKLKQQFAQLIDNEPMFQAGKEDEMVGRLHIKLCRRLKGF